MYRNIINEEKDATLTEKQRNIMSKALHQRNQDASNLGPVWNAKECGPPLYFSGTTKVRSNAT